MSRLRGCGSDGRLLNAMSCSRLLYKLFSLFPKQNGLIVKTKAVNVLRLSLLEMEMSGLYCVRIFNFKNCSLSYWCEFHKKNVQLILDWNWDRIPNFWSGSKQTSAAPFTIYLCKMTFMTIKYWSTLRTVEDTLHILLYQICSQDLILDSKIKGTLISLVCRLVFVFNGW